MPGLFSPDSKFMMAMSRVADLVILNLFFLLTCIPIFTIGAATTAMYSVCFRLGTQREEGLVRTYFRAFRENFKQSTLLWLILAVFLAASCCNTMLAYNSSDTLGYAYLVFVLVLVVQLMIAAYAFPLLSQFQNNNLTTVKNALLLSVGYLPRTLVILVLNVLPVGVLLVNPYVFFRFSILWLGIYFAGAAFISTCLLRKVFAPYMTENQDEKILEE